MQKTLSYWNREVIRIAREVFAYDSKDWAQVKKDLTPEQVRDFYGGYRSIWDINTLPESYLLPEDKLTALYLGDTDVRKLARTVNSSLLYTDTVGLLRRPPSAD